MVEDFRDLLAELVTAEVRFLVVGAHALGVHGVPRATIDLDVWVERTPENARKVWHALVAFGAPLDELNVAERTSSDQTWWCSSACPPTVSTSSPA